MKIKAFIIIWCVWAAICLSLAVGVVYAAIHFLQKFW
jgi:hypothetical protein